MFGYEHGYTYIRSGRSNGRNLYQRVLNGKITITEKERNGDSFVRVVEIKEGDIWSNKLLRNGKVEYHI